MSTPAEAGRPEPVVALQHPDRFSKHDRRHPSAALDERFGRRGLIPRLSLRAEPGRWYQRRAYRCRIRAGCPLSSLQGCGSWEGRWEEPRRSSSNVESAALRTTIRPSCSSHSSTDPGPRPSFLRTTAGTEICPCEVSLECATAIALHYHGNGRSERNSCITD